MPPPQKPVRLYTAFSIADFLLSLIFRCGIAAGLVYCSTQYEENPPVIIIVIAIGVLALLWLGSEQITVYSNRIELSNNSIGEWIFKQKNTVYSYEHLQKASIQQHGSELDSLVAMTLMNMMDKRPSKHIKFFLDYKDGTTQTITTHIHIQQVVQVVDLINQCIKTG